ncbi:hypothetical protein [Nostoc favosum]|uniref:Uncharacterized protein n=1 Tax=Nostoc favosum CHAB5714 TaxID=2780399 RepID=A0ABS8I1D8_9NOSO|nr:hypothetical protein [Nostoc favosum]MCC5598044.1 hypothetical protein [Nostoc favosum CHAB5714]
MTRNTKYELRLKTISFVRAQQCCAPTASAVATTGSHCGGREHLHKASGVGTPLRVHQSPTAGNPPTALDSPQRAASPVR